MAIANSKVTFIWDKTITTTPVFPGIDNPANLDFEGAPRDTDIKVGASELMDKVALGTITAGELKMLAKMFGDMGTIMQNTPIADLRTSAGVGILADYAAILNK